MIQRSNKLQLVYHFIDFAIIYRLKFMSIFNRRTQAFDMTGGMLSYFPWIRYIAPKISGYKLLIEFNHELKRFLMVKFFRFIFVLILEFILYLPILMIDTLFWMFRRLLTITKNDILKEAKQTLSTCFSTKYLNIKIENLFLQVWV